MSGYEDLKKAFTSIAKDREARQNKIYMAKVVSVEPLKISNGYFGILDKSQVSILDKVKRQLKDIDTTVSDKHSHKIKGAPFKVGDEVLVLLYEQELEQKFIIIDKVVGI